MIIGFVDYVFQMVLILMMSFIVQNVHKINLFFTYFTCPELRKMLLNAGPQIHPPLFSKY
jgi:hypothetical protein